MRNARYNEGPTVLILTHLHIYIVFDGTGTAPMSLGYTLEYGLAEMGHLVVFLLDYIFPVQKVKDFVFLA